MDAADFGVPQHRKRLFVVGSSSERFEFPHPTHGPKASLPYVAAGQALKDVPDDAPNKAIVTYAKNPVLRPSPFAGMLVNGQGRPIDLTKPANTVPASAGGNRTHILDPKQLLVKYHEHLTSGGKPKEGIIKGLRRLTVREPARLQAFPDDFVFWGTRSSQYSQVGNAIPPTLAHAVAAAIREQVLCNNQEDVLSKAK